MEYANNQGDHSPLREYYEPEVNHTLKAYLLECKLLRILAENVPSKNYDRLHDQTGICRYDLASAVEDQAFFLDQYQLQHALNLFQSRGLLPLIHFLHQPYFMEKPESASPSPQPLSQLLEESYELGEMVCPEEEIEDWCRQHDLQASWQNGDWMVHPYDLFDFFEPYS